MIAERVLLSIARDFTTTPGPRKKIEGDFSGEQFLEEVLMPRFNSAQESGNILYVDLDGTIGSPSSFLEEAFGGLARQYGTEKVDKGIEIKCEEEPYLEEKIREYIRKAMEKR